MTVATRHSSYLSNVFSSPKELHDSVRKVKRVLKKFVADGNGYDAIVCRGVSGITVASIASYALKKQLIVVRKPDEKSHSAYRLEGMPEEGNVRYVIVDDFICTGETFVNIAQDIRDHKPKATNPIFMGTVLHGAGQFERVHNLKETKNCMWACYEEEFDKLI